MPIIGSVARRSFKVRLLNLSIHLVLILGGVTMVYPFLITISESFKSPVDRTKLEVIPSYFHDDTVLYKKYIEAKYNERTPLYANSSKKRLLSFSKVAPPAKPVAARDRDWNEFLDQTLPALKEDYYGIGHAYNVQNNMVPEMSWRFRQELKAESEVRGSIEKMNEKYNTEYEGWEIIFLPRMGSVLRAEALAYGDFTRRSVEFVNRQKEQAPENLLFASVDAVFIETFLKSRYGSDLRTMNQELGTSFRSWREVCLSRTVPNEADSLRADWIKFVKEKLSLPFIEVTQGALPAYREMLRTQYEGKMALFNKRYGTEYDSFDQVQLPQEPPREGVAFGDWVNFITATAPPEHLRLRTLEFMYRDFLRHKYGTVSELNQAQEFGLKHLSELKLSVRAPMDNLAILSDWRQFSGEIADPEWVTADAAALLDYREFLTAPFRKSEQEVDFAALNQRYGTDFRNTENIPLPAAVPANPDLRTQWRKFLAEECKPALLRLDAEKAAASWQQFIGGKYPDADTLNQAYGLICDDFDRVVMPIEQADYFALKRNRRHIMWEFVVRNYRIVIDVMLLSGRSIMNTGIYCGLAVLAALIVNPMAAYALSRYKPPSSYKILLFLMLTMAFPPMVLGIPQFLLIRTTGLLNTFAALILPTMANGYSIFLLKGFFDSLPRELYESAQLDGASEWTMFWTITMATSKPILAVIGLWAFTKAYGNFMMAFILCQNPKMWTMMVNVYQLMQKYSPSVGYAAVLVAAVPTFLVFVFCQNIIIRGIVVPTEK